MVLASSRSVDFLLLTWRGFPYGIYGLLDEATHITDFQFHLYREPFGNNNDPLVLAAAIQRHPNLRHLEFGAYPQNNGYVLAILNALRRNKVLQKLTITMQRWSNETFQSFQMLMQSTTTLRELHIPILVDCNITKNDLLKLVKTNFSLRTFTTGDEAFFNQDDQRSLQSYFTRNELMEQFSDNPATVIPNKKLWSHVVGAAAQNPSVLFQTLRAASTELFHEQRTRKRKRPAYYKPSAK